MNDKSNCPPKQTLIDFLLGKLEPSQVATCEQHLNDCKPCGDTIRGLDASDTISGLASNSKQSSADDDKQDSDQLVVKMLIDKMQEMQPARSSSGKQAATSPSRADEVINLLQPMGSSDSIGQLAHYEIQELLGVGATSVVFRARDEQLHRDVALKVLRPSLGEGARERFLAEARAAAALNHENVTTIYQVATEGHLAYMAQQWLPGETLEARLERDPELEIEEIKSISLQVANGLAAAHSKNLIHRDIKPANIWIDSERNRAIILDFGLVRVADDETQMTETGMIAGTPNYMSPEQTRGCEVDSRSDLFSLGCVMYRMCTGRLPFQAGNTLATLQAIQNDSSPPPRHLNTQIPAEISELVMMLLNKNVEGRPRSADQVATALQDSTVMKELLAVRTHYQVAAGRRKSPPRRHWWLWGAAATLLIALLLLSGPQIIRVVTNHGVLEIETDDPNVAVEVLQSGEVVYVIDQETDQRLEIAAGTYKIQPHGDDNSFDLSQNTLTMKRGGKVVVTVTKLASGEPTQSQLNPPALPANEYSSPINSVGQSIHQVAIADLSARIKVSQDQLSRLNVDKQRVSDALASGPERADEMLWILRQKGDVKVDPGELDKTSDEVGDINRKIQTLEMELDSIKSRFSSAHPGIKAVQSKISIWKDYLAGIEADNKLGAEEILQRYLKLIDQQIADLKHAIETDSSEFANHQKRLEQSESGRSTVALQRAKDMHEQVANRMHQFKIERETAEATLDWEAAISAAETIVELYKSLVSTAIELRELGEMTPARVDMLKQQLLRENSRLTELKQFHAPQIPLETLEQQYEIAHEKCDQLEQQFKAGEIEGQKFWPSQLEFFESEAALYEARGEFSLALVALGNIVKTRQSILNSVVIRRDAGVPSDFGFVEATIGLENAEARLVEFKEQYGLLGSLPESRNLNQGIPNTTKNQNTNAAKELTYDGRTFDEWLTILDTERSPGRLNSALNAIQQLGQEQDSRQAVDAIMRISRVFGNDQAFKLVQHAREIFANIPRDIVIDAFLRELQVKNQGSGDFLTTFSSWYLDPASHVEFSKILAERSAEMQDSLFEIIDSELASESREHLEWSTILLAELLTKFDFFKPDNHRALVERIRRTLPLIESDYTKIAFVRYLANAGEKTAEYEDMLLDLLLPKTPSPHFGFQSPYKPLILDTLKDMGPDNTTNKTVETVSLMLSDDKYWPTGFGAPAADARPNESKIRAIELIGSLGEKSASALPVLQKIVASRDLYSEAALQAIIQIAVPQSAREDALALQGKWRTIEPNGDNAKPVGSSEVVFRGLYANQYFRGLGGGRTGRGGASGAGLASRGGGSSGDANDSRIRERLWVGTQAIEFTDTRGELDFLDQSSMRIKGIYKLNGDVLKLSLAKNAEASRPMSFDETDDSHISLVLERSK